MKLENKQVDERYYTIYYIGIGSKPSVFDYEILESSGNVYSGIGELEKQDEFEIDIACSGVCDTLPKKIPIIIQWEGKKKK